MPQEKFSTYPTFIRSLFKERDRQKKYLALFLTLSLVYGEKNF
jgi:hypothetical protein